MSSSTPKVSAASASIGYRIGVISVGLRQAEHALGDEAENQLPAHRRDAPDERLAQVALDVVLARVAEAAVGHHRLLACVEAGFAREVLGGVRLGAARLAGVV